MPQSVFSLLSLFNGGYPPPPSKRRNKSEGPVHLLTCQPHFLPSSFLISPGKDHVGENFCKVLHISWRGKGVLCRCEYSCGGRQLYIYIYTCVIGLVWYWARNILFVCILGFSTFMHFCDGKNRWTSFKDESFKVSGLGDKISPHHPPPSSPHCGFSCFYFYFFILYLFNIITWGNRLVILFSVFFCGSPIVGQKRFLADILTITKAKRALNNLWDISYIRGGEVDPPPAKKVQNAKNIQQSWKTLRVPPSHTRAQFAICYKLFEVFFLNQRQNYNCCCWKYCTCIKTV